MKSLEIFGFLLLVTLVSSDELFLPGKRIKSRATKPVAEICANPSGKIKRFCNGSPEGVCDATGFVYCTGKGKGIEFECGDDLPYCGVNSNGEAMCTSEKSEECGPSTPDFECLDDGVFPDPLNCKKYYYCSSDGQGGFVADEFQCSNYYVFDPSAPREEYCRFTWNRYCITANCQGKAKNILMNYPFFPTARGQVVAVCRGTKKPLIVRCAEGLTAKLDTLPVECVVNCRGAGKYEYAEDSSKYYECVFTGRVYEARVKSCFRNYNFDKKSKQCVLSPFTTTPVVSTTTPVDSTTTPVGSTTTPVGSTTTPVGSTTTPVDSTTTPVVSTTTPVGSTIG